MPPSGNFLPPSVRINCATGRQSNSKPTTTKITCICFHGQRIALSVSRSLSQSEMEQCRRCQSQIIQTRFTRWGSYWSTDPLYVMLLPFRQTCNQ